MGRNAAVEIKIAYIGGGSRGWARSVMTDLALCPQFKGEMALYDIEPIAAELNVGVGQAIFQHREARTKFRVRACKTSAEALKGADFVFLSITPGPMRMFANDIDIPARYGILQPVADTTGPGGISRALRTIPTYVAYAREIMKICPHAWVINYTNPMTLCVSALYAAEPDIKAFGCCHEVFGTQHKLARLVEQYLKVPRPPRQEIQADVAGVNHFTFVPAASWNGHDLYPLIARHIQTQGLWDDQTEFALESRARGRWFTSKGLIAYDFFRRFGVLGAAGDRHLAEFVPWYLTSEENLNRYGVILTPSLYRLSMWDARERDIAAYRQGKRAKPKIETLKRSGEEGINQLLALAGLASLDTNVNLPNQGQMPDLPLGAVVETNAQFRKDSVRPVVSKPLPAGVSELVRRVIATQRLTLEAGLNKDKDLAFQAILSDPLCRIPVDRAWAMFNEMLQANKAMLPGWGL